MKKSRDKDYIQFDTSENDEAVQKIKNDNDKQDTLAYYNEDMARAAVGRVFQGVNQEEIKKNQRQHTSHDVFDNNKDKQKDVSPTFSYTNEELDELNGITKASEDFIMKEEDKPKNRKKQPYSYIDDAEEKYRDYSTSNRSEIVNSFYGKENVNYTNARSKTTNRKNAIANQPYESKVRKESVYINVQTANINKKKYDYDSKERYDEDYVDNTPYEENDDRDYVLNYDQLPYSKTSTTGYVSKKHTDSIKLAIDEQEKEKEKQQEMQRTDRIENLKKNRNTATKMKPVIDSTGKVEVVGEKEQNGEKVKKPVTTVRKKKNNNAVAIIRISILTASVVFAMSTVYLLWNNNKYKDELATMTEKYNEATTIKSNATMLELQIEELQEEIKLLKGEVEDSAQGENTEGTVDENATVTENSTGLPTTYTVQSGDTLSKISQKFYNTPNQYPAIEAANNLTSGDLVIGQQLNIPNLE